MIMAHVIIDEYMKLLNKKIELEKVLSVLPQGYISKKNINGKTYYYLQNRVSGKMTGEYLKKIRLTRFPNNSLYANSMKQNFRSLTFGSLS